MTPFQIQKVSNNEILIALFHYMFVATVWDTLSRQLGCAV